MASLNVKTVAMRTIALSVLPSSSSVIKEAALMLKGAAMVNPTVLITLMNRTVKPFALLTNSAVVTASVSLKNNSVTIILTVPMDQMSLPVKMYHRPPLVFLILGPAPSVQSLLSSCLSS